MRKVVLCTALVVTFMAMLCGVSYSASDAKCAPCAKYEKCIGEPFTFDASKSCANGVGPCASTLCYTWDFGDGTTGEGMCVTHCYEKPGEYTVKLTVTDNSGLPCNTDAISQVVKVNCPPKAAFSGPDCACAGQEITFDASASTSETAKELNYTWDFGDGCTGEGKVVKHVYDCGGCKRVTLTVDDGSCSNCCKDSAYLDVRVNSAPCAEAGPDVCMQCICPDANQEICFQGSGSDPEGDCLTYMWNFGDGTSAEGQSVTHRYEKPGTYKATLVVNDGCNSTCSTGSDCKTVYISYNPVADAGGDIKECVGNAVNLDGSKSVVYGSSPKYTWDFGDGETGEGVKVSHMYKCGGNYVATLTVTDGECVSCDTACIELNTVPGAGLCGPENACTGENIKFDASASNDPDNDALKYTWDFGDGKGAQEGCHVMCYSFDKGGTYTVKVTIDDCKGTPCSVDSASMVVKVNGRPNAVIAPCDACCVGKEILWDGSSSSDPDGDALKYSWDFGDGTTADGAKPTHVYKEAGTYRVTLCVDDQKGTQCSTSFACYTACIHDKPKAELCVE